MSRIIGLNKYLPKYYGITFFGDLQVIKLEYINQSLDEHVETFKNDLNRTSKLVDIFLQMFDAIQVLH